MKHSLFYKIGIFSLLTLSPLALYSQNQTQTPATSSELIAQMQNLLNQYSERIRFLENENQVLRTAMAKNGIQIPLSEFNATFSGSVNSSENVVTQNVHQNTNTQNTSIGQNDLQNGFIKQFRLDWQDVRKAYGMPADARIGMYEFVVNDAQNNVFVNVEHSGGTPDKAYNIKLLYSFDKKTFKRTLIGLFEYDTNSKAYITKKGNNPFAGTERIRIFENASPVAVNTVTNATTTTPQVAVQNTATTEIENKMREAYLAKNYAQVFSLSDAYLKNNIGTYLMYFHRYRTYFAQGQYQKALDEIGTMEKNKIADAKIYCDAYAISTVIKNNTLANKYKNLAGAGCKLTP